MRELLPGAGLFEGRSLEADIQGNPDQALYIKDKREAIGAPVKLYLYDTGHDIFKEAQASIDIVNFVDHDDAVDGTAPKTDKPKMALPL